MLFLWRWQLQPNNFKLKLADVSCHSDLVWALHSRSPLPITCEIMGFLLSGVAKRGFQSLCTSPLSPSPCGVPVWSAPAPSASVSTSTTSHPLSHFGTDATEALQVNVCHWLANGRFYSIVWSFDSSLLKKWSTNTRIAWFVKNLILSCDKKCLKGLLACLSLALLQCC